MSKRPNVTFVRPELQRLLSQYVLIADAIGGEQAVKAKGVKYLPMPDPGPVCGPDAKAKMERYQSYLTRAVYFNITRRTLEGLVGYIFMRPPVENYDERLKLLTKDVTGTGLSLTQLSKELTKRVVSNSRAGLFIDYPKTDKVTSLAEKELGVIRPKMFAYSATEITNWRTVERGAEDILSLVVLKESYIYEDDGFEVKPGRQLRVLSLQNNVYRQDIWRENKKDPGGEEFDVFPNTNLTDWYHHETFTPTDAKGNTFDKIPFTFVGSVNNDPNPDNPNFYDIASLNIAHYRNSADLEESLFISGQPTLAITGLTEAWVSNNMKGEVKFGARAGIPLPEGGKAELLQVNPNQVLIEAMDRKEQQMVALGAKLVEGSKAVQKTATEAKIESASEVSVLASCALNVQAAIEFGLEWFSLFDSGQPIIKPLNEDGEEDALFVLNTDFDLSSMDPTSQGQAINAWEKSAISFVEMRNVLRKGGVATEDDDLVKAEAEEKAEKTLRDEERRASLNNKMVNNNERGK